MTFLIWRLHRAHAIVSAVVIVALLPVVGVVLWYLLGPKSR